MIEKNEIETHSRDEMITLGRELAQFAREKFLENPYGMHVIQINGDKMSGKSLLLDVIRAELFDKKEIARPKERLLSNYSGEINGCASTITLANIEGTALPYCLLSEVFLAAARLTHRKPGILFVLNRPKRNLGNIAKLFPLPKAIMHIDVKYPESFKQPFAFKYLGIKKLRPNTWSRKIMTSSVIGQAMVKN